MEIRLPNKEYNIPYTPSGDKEYKVYEYKYNKDGTKELVVVAKRNRQDEIQSYADEVDIVKIIERLGGIQNLSLLEQRGAYMDMTQMPRNLYEAMELQERARSNFAKLPTVIREAYNNDPLQFLASVGSDKMNTLYKKYIEDEYEKQKKVSSPNKEDEKEVKE